MFPKDNVLMIDKALRMRGINNIVLRAGAITVATTEGGFQPKEEMSYKNTPNERLRMLFYKLKGVADSIITKAKSNDTVFFDLVYGGLGGNIAVGDGFKYRGRGFNQITFRKNYAALCTPLGVDLITRPELLNTPSIAADALASYFKSGFEVIDAYGGPSTLDYFKFVKCEDVADLKEAAELCLHINAGWKTSLKNARLAEELRQEQINVYQIYDIIK